MQRWGKLEIIPAPDTPYSSVQFTGSPEQSAAYSWGKWPGHIFRSAVPPDEGGEGRRELQEQSAVITEGRAHTTRAALQLLQGPTNLAMPESYREAMCMCDEHQTTKKNY